MLAPPLDQAEDHGIPEHCGAAHAEDDLESLGKSEEIGDAPTEAPDHVLDGRLPVAGTEVGAGAPGQRGDGLGPDLRGP
jgi:hypothetical protein